MSKTRPTASVVNNGCCVLSEHFDNGRPGQLLSDLEARRAAFQWPS